MTVKDLINEIYAKVNGEYEVLEIDSEDYNTYLHAMNRKIQDWAQTPRVKWASLYNPEFVLGETLSANTEFYEFKDRIIIGNTPRDHIDLIKDGEVIDRYKLTNQSIFESTDDNKLAMLYNNGIRFKLPIAEEVIGCEVRMPAYQAPPKYTKPNETVVIDSIPWLISATSADLCYASPVPFIARNAVVFEKQAEEFMKTMKRNNNHRQHGFKHDKDPYKRTTISSGGYWRSM